MTLAERLADDPRYRALVARRSRFGATLSAAMLVVYLGFLLLVAFAKPLLAMPVAGGATTLGIPLGLGVILFAVALTALYVWRANRAFDPAMAALIAEHEREPCA